MGRIAILAGMMMAAAVAAPLAAELPDLSEMPQPKPSQTLEKSAGSDKVRQPPEYPGPVAFFEQLVDRYRRLTGYRDTTSIIEITERAGQLPERVEKRVACAIRDGELEITTPKRQLLRHFGVALPIAPVPVLDAAAGELDRLLAPHMTMKFAREPLQEFRPGVAEGFTATEVGPVTIDRKEWVHLKLKSGDGRGDQGDATFDLFVDPKSMLIERIEGEQLLADGTSRQTTISIDPQRESIVEQVGAGTLDVHEDDGPDDQHTGDDRPPASDPEIMPPDPIPPSSLPPETAPPEAVPPEAAPPEATPPMTDPPVTDPPGSTPPGSAPPDTTPPDDGDDAGGSPPGGAEGDGLPGDPPQEDDDQGQQQGDGEMSGHGGAGAAVGNAGSVSRKPKSVPRKSAQSGDAGTGKRAAKPKVGQEGSKPPAIDMFRLQ